jgi:hypothetical protein
LPEGAAIIATPPATACSGREFASEARFRRSNELIKL